MSLPLLSPSPRRQAVIKSRRKKIERLVLKGTKQQPTQVMVMLTPPTARMVLTPPTMRKLTIVKLVSRWLIQRGRDQNRRGPRRIKAKKRRQLLLQRKRYYISAIFIMIGNSTNQKFTGRCQGHLIEMLQPNPGSSSVRKNNVTKRAGVFILASPSVTNSAILLNKNRTFLASGVSDRYTAAT